jgi:hypothetical protein
MSGEPVCRDNSMLHNVEKPMRLIYTIGFKSIEIITHRTYFALISNSFYEFGLDNNRCRIY